MGCLVLAALLTSQTAGAQVSADARYGVAFTDTLRVAPDSSLQVRPFVIRATLRVRILNHGEEPGWTLDPVRGRITLRGSFGGPGALAEVSYRALDLGIRNEYVLERRPVDIPRGRREPRVSSVESGVSPPAPGLRSSGSISRGLIGGSGRDVAIESGLRLDLDGELAPGVEIRASLTDADSPIRPDGTTQRLSEFDRVFIELSARPGRVTLGDFDARLLRGEYSRLSRKLEGIQVETAAGGRVTAKGIGATSRGQFRSQPITPVDGVQGPYRLEGEQGERFILLIPGSERVYLDGRVLTRGEGQDYTVDYSTGDLFFTPRQVITAERRILVEFEYSTNQFTRTLLGSEFDVALRAGALGRVSIGGSVIREADTGDFLSEFGLSAADSLLLSVSGDAAAYRSGAQRVVFDSEARYVQYEQRVISGDTVFVVLNSAPAGDTPVFRVQFTRVGNGQGRYARDTQAVNGISYVYRGPGGGAYEPLRRLPSPQRKSLIGFRGGLEPMEGLTLQGEWAASAFDLNRLSTRDAADDHGSAYRFRLETPALQLGPWGGLRASGSVRQSSRHFNAFERYRPVEFARQWNLIGIEVNPLGTPAGADHERESEVGLHWIGADSSSIRLTRARLGLPGVFDASRTEGTARMSLGRGASGLLEMSRVDSDDKLRSRFGSWRREFGRLDHTVGSTSLYAEIEHEHRQDGRDDSLHSASIEFTEVRPGVSWTHDTGSVTAQVERRSESWPMGGKLAAAASSWTLTSRSTYRPGPAFRNELEIGYRIRDIRDGFSGQMGTGDTRALLLGLRGAARRGATGIEWLYDARTERTPVLQELFLRTGPELGAYVWVDENQDQVVQLDELLPESTPNEGTYVRTFLPSDSLASVNVVRARSVARFRPVGRPGLWGRVSLQTLLEVEERTRSANRWDVYLLKLGTFRRPGVTTNGRVRVRQDVSIRQGKLGPGLDASFQEVRSMSELASGVETRLSRQGEVTVRQRLAAWVESSIQGSLSRDRTTSERFASRRFDLFSRRLTPSVILRSGRRITTRLSVDLVAKRDPSSGVRATILRTPVSVRLSTAGKSDVLVRAELSRVSIRGSVPRGLAAFELTDGRGPGASGLWGVTAQWALNSSLRATLAYDGRAPSSGRVIHTGRMELSAVF